MSDAGRCRLKLLLKRKKMTQKQLAVITKIKLSQISDYCNDRRRMSLTTAKRIADVLACHIEDLYEWDD